MRDVSAQGKSELWGPAVTVDASRGIPGLIREMSVRRPEAVACADRAGELTYLALELASDAVARTLRQTAQSDAPIVVCLPRSVSLVVALLGVLKSGRPYLPVDPADPADRLRGIVRTAGSTIALTTSETAGAAEAAGLWALDVRALMEQAAAEPDPVAEVADDHPVYVLFTSGSTGNPKGVVVPNLALCNRIVWMREEYGIRPEDRILQKTPATFDVSGWEFWLPLISGARCVLLPPDDHRDPALVAQAIIRDEITVCHFVPSMLREFLRWPDARECGRLRLVFCSGEALPVSVARRFTEVLSARLHNLYGPTEAAIDVTFWPCPDDADRIDRVLIGRPVWNCLLTVRGQDGTPVPPGAEGELCIGGTPLALGYLNRPDLTERVFVPAPEGLGVPRLYRTGDRVRLDGDQIEYLGRIDDQMKIRGQRIEPQEVEHHLAGHPGVAASVAVAARIGDDVELVAFIVPAVPGTDSERARTLRRFLAGRVPPAYVPTRFLTLDTIPFTSSGKQDRKALRALAEERLGHPAEEAGPSEKTGPAERGRAVLNALAEERVRRAPDQLAEIWSSALSSAEAGSKATFQELGGHSLLGARIAADLMARLGVMLPAGYFVRHDPTLAQLRATVAGLPCRPAAEAPVPDGRAAPGQRRLWVLSKLFPTSPAYNVVGALKVGIPLEAGPLLAAVTRVAGRHRLLRAALRESDRGELRLDVAETCPLLVHVETVEDDPDGEAVERFARTRADVVFDLERPPLFEVAARVFADGTSVLVATFHHAISDQRSLDVFLTDLSAAYQGGSDQGGPDQGGPESSAEAGDYLEYAAARARSRAADGAADLEYWSVTLDGAPRVLTLPFQRVRPASPTFRGSAVSRTLPQALDRAVTDLARRRGCTPATVFLAAAGTVLARWTAERDVVIGVAVTDRAHARWQSTIGFFVETVPVRVDLRDTPSLDQALTRVREGLANGMEHTAAPFDEVAAMLRVERDPSVNPLFQVWFNDLSRAAPPARFGGADAEPRPLPVRWSLFDLGFYLHREDDVHRLEVVHALDVYGPEVAAALADQCLTALRAMAGDAAQPVTGFGAPQTPPRTLRHPDARTVSMLAGAVLARADAHPDRPAVLTPAGTLRYGELADAVRRLAMDLDRRLAPGVPVALAAERHALLPVALLACWHTERPVLIMDARAPKAWRLSGCAAVGAAAVLAFSGQDDLGLPVIRVEPPVTGGSAARVPSVAETTGDSPVAGAVREPSIIEGVPADPNFGHALLTSGTTGEPSVVLLASDALPAAWSWYAEKLGLGEDDVFAVLAGPGHDPVLREAVLPLTLGARVFIPAKQDRSDPARLLAALDGAGCTVVGLTPGQAELLMAGASARAGREVPLPRLRRVTFHGAMLTDTIARGIAGLAPHAQLHNVYGATETPQASSLWRWTEPDAKDPWQANRRSVPVGRGTEHRSLDVVTETGEIAATGQLGDVVVSGHGLAIGYAGRPARTGGALRTGDLGRLTPDGDVEICGRADRQISLRGYRVEPAAVEAALVRLRGVRTAVAAASPDRPGTLAAWVTADDPAPSPEELWRGLARILPSWSMPEQIVIVDRIPLSRNGKPDLSMLANVKASVVVAPARTATALERDLLRLITERSGHHPEAEENLFDAGLTSLDIVRLHDALRESYDVDIIDLFRFPTIRSLATHLAAGRTTPRALAAQRGVSNERDIRQAVRRAVQQGGTK